LEPTIKILEDIETKSYSVCDGFISSSETEVLLSKIKTLREQDLFKQASIGNKDLKQTDSGIRMDSILWLEKGDLAIDNFFFAKIETLITELNRAFYLGINDHEFHLAHYETGAFYKKHKDVFKSDDARRISVILYLNQNWKKENGGELKLYLKASEINIEPIAGRLVIFESHLEHEVLESKTDRYSITGWLKRKKLPF
jgi:SM-20-related protein